MGAGAADLRVGYFHGLFPERFAGFRADDPEVVGGDGASQIIGRDRPSQRQTGTPARCGRLADRLRHGIPEITSEVSLTARPFFKRHGYQVVKAQKARARQLWLTNFVMSKSLHP